MIFQNLFHTHEIIIVSDQKNSYKGYLSAVDNILITIEKIFSKCLEFKTIDVFDYRRSLFDIQILVENVKFMFIFLVFSCYRSNKKKINETSTNGQLTIAYMNAVQNVNGHSVAVFPLWCLPAVKFVANVDNYKFFGLAFKITGLSVIFVDKTFLLVDSHTFSFLSYQHPSTSIIISMFRLPAAYILGLNVTKSP